MGIFWAVSSVCFAALVLQRDMCILSSTSTPGNVSLCRSRSAKHTAGTAQETQTAAAEHALRAQDCAEGDHDRPGTEHASCGWGYPTY